MTPHLLIANNGLQFITWHWNPSFSAHTAANPFHYFNVFDRGRWFIQEVHAVELEGEKYYLNDEDFQRLKNDISIAKVQQEVEAIQACRDELRKYNVDEPLSIPNLQADLRRWLGHWIPIPFVEAVSGIDDQFQARFAPRIYMEATEIGYNCTLCLNTSLDGLEGRRFNVASNSRTIFSFLDERTNLTGRLDYLEGIYFKSDEERIQEQGRAFASYITFVRAIAQSKTVSLEFTTKQEVGIPVDCFIDLGNSNTSVVLQETSNLQRSFFGKCASLEIRDFSSPTKTYEGTFPSRILFDEASFASNPLLLDDEHFNWPSSARIGKEAEQGIAELKNGQSQNHIQAYLSSPKRYLWDLNRSETEWQQLRKHDPDGQSIPVQIEGYSEDGVLLVNSCGQRLAGVEGTMHFGPKKFSKSSLNRFFFIELLMHAQCQINSVRFRKRMGDEYRRRYLRHVVVTCPTGMLQSEQALLRKYAKEALAFVTNHPSFIETDITDITDPQPIVYPSEKDILMPLENLGDRKSWMYDEATCVQLLYLYGTLQHQFNRNVKAFTQSFQEGRNDSVRIATVDLGGGTCDLMVCDHSCTSQNDSVHVVPKPVFWDSWTRAGDDLRRELVERLIVPNLLHEMVQKSSIFDPAHQLSTLIGSAQGLYDTERVGFIRSFMQTIAMPITQLYLQHANDDCEPFELSYHEVFGSNGVSKSILRRIQNHCQINLAEMKWKIEPRTISSLCQNFFGHQLKSIAGVFGRLKCDIVLLSGGTFKIHALEDSFLKSLCFPVSRVQNLNNWKPGNWHPFTDGKGVLNDAKSTVALGAVIALHSGLTRTLPGFSMNFDHLKTEVKSTARALWRTEGGALTPVLAAEQNKVELEVDNLPTLMSVSAIDSPNYPVKAAYRLELDTERMKERLRDRGETESAVHQSVMQKVNEIMSKTPLLFKLERDRALGYESIGIEEVIDRDENSIPTSLFRITGQTLMEQEYWIENGVDISS
jgi:hypothetical protein